MLSVISLTHSFEYCVNSTIQLHVIPWPNANTTSIQVYIQSIKTDGYVYFYRNNKDNYTTYYHPWFLGRVSRNGSVISVYNAKLNDSATYTVLHTTSGSRDYKHYIITVNNCTTSSHLMPIKRHYKFTVSSFCCCILIVIFMLLFTVLTM